MLEIANPVMCKRELRGTRRHSHLDPAAQMRRGAARVIAQVIHESRRAHRHAESQLFALEIVSDQPQTAVGALRLEQRTQSRWPTRLEE